MDDTPVDRRIQARAGVPRPPLLLRRRTRPSAVLRAAGVSALVACALLAGAARPAGGADPPFDLLMRQLLHPDTAVREPALREIVRRGDRSAVPGLIDILYSGLFLDSSVANALARFTGQSFGHGWRSARTSARTRTMRAGRARSSS